ncbi:hypothetical protein [Mesotoga sp. B105.6.4]|uniref:hypothetical protein n=1 Tax=Mesotoga sp. B105.6.4 TaxID=1582224 RepID=UPI000CCC04DB|nr:hypothetical protein [Mesotoga sp. B105.6.4]
MKIEKLPAHKFIGIRNINAKGYFHFWELQEGIPGQDCHTVTGLLESIQSLNGQIGGWYFEGEKRGYLYGIKVPMDYNGEVPKGMECTVVSESEYVVFTTHLTITRKKTPQSCQPSTSWPGTGIPKTRVMNGTLRIRSTRGATRRIMDILSAVPLNF